jgi:hypothetical protein
LAVAIFFSCLCGQPLRADEDGTASHTRCLACGRLNRVPSVKRANQALGIDAAGDAELDIEPAEPPPPALPIPPVPVPKLLLVEDSQMPPVRPVRKPPRSPGDEEGDSPYRLAPEKDADTLGDLRARIDRDKVRRLLREARKELNERQQRERPWELETHWSHCLLYPLRATLQVGLLAVGWATATALVIAFLPENWNAAQLSIFVPFLPFYFLLLAYTLCLLQITLAAATRGFAGTVALPARDLLPIARSGVQGIVCLLAGPIVPLIVAYFFWLDCGDLEGVDRLILAELGLVAAVCWALLFLAVTEKDALLYANPVAVAKLIRRVGFRVPVAALLMGIALGGHGYLIFGAMEDLHRGLLGWLELVGLWTGQLYWLLFVLRWLGVSMCRLRLAPIAQNAGTRRA